MKCPRCNEELERRDQQGVEIDCCPECHGVWLDRGELHEIVGVTSSAILELAKTMAGGILAPDGEPGRTTLVLSRDPPGEQ